MAPDQALRVLFWRTSVRVVTKPITTTVQSYQGSTSVEEALKVARLAGGAPSRADAETLRRVCGDRVYFPEFERWYTTVVHHPEDTFEYFSNYFRCRDIAWCYSFGCFAGANVQRWGTFDGQRILDTCQVGICAPKRQSISYVASGPFVEYNQLIRIQKNEVFSMAQRALSQLKPLGRALHDFDIDEVLIDEGTRRSALGDIARGENVTSKQRAAFEAAALTDTAFGEVKDAQGRRRFHGAFTGGFSAGYFNTVGSEQGWTPAQFRSSRSARELKSQQRISDFADEEDLQTLRTSRAVLDFGDALTNRMIPSLVGNKVQGTLTDGVSPNLAVAAILDKLQALATPASDIGEHPTQLFYLGSGAQLFNKCGGLTRGCPKTHPHDATFQSLICRPRPGRARTCADEAEVPSTGPLAAAEPEVKSRKIGPVMPDSLRQLKHQQSRTKTAGMEDQDLEIGLVRSRTQTTAAALQTFLSTLRNPRINIGSVGYTGSDSPLWIFAVDESVEDRASMVSIQFTTSLLPMNACSIYREPVARTGMHVVSEQLPGEASSKQRQIIPMAIREPQGVLPLAKRLRTDQYVEPQFAHGLRGIMLGKSRLEWDDGEEPENEVYDVEIEGHRSSSALHKESDEDAQDDLMTGMNARIALIQASQNCILGFARATSDCLTRGFDWTQLRTSLSVKAPSNFYLRPRRTRDEFTEKTKIARELKVLPSRGDQSKLSGLWAPPGMGLRTQIAMTNRFHTRFSAAGQGDSGILAHSEKQPESLNYQAKRFWRWWKPNRDLLKAFAVLCVSTSNNENPEAMKQDIGLYLQSLEKDPNYAATFHLPKITGLRVTQPLLPRSTEMAVQPPGSTSQAQLPNPQASQDYSALYRTIFGGDSD